MTVKDMFHSFCRSCPNSCPVLVDVVDGVLERVRGDPDNPVFDGYTCVKGRAQPALHNHGHRLTKSLKRLPNGAFVPISSETVLEEIADRLATILDRFGPRSVASYLGTAMLSDCLTEPFLNAFMSAIGSRMTFNPNTIDKPGKQLALALHGSWMAPLQGYDRPAVALILGANPFKSYFGVACGNPAKWLGERLAAGMQLIVIDPKRSDLAKRATLHIQPVPGEDAAILACLINVILAEGLHDRDFVAGDTKGVDALADAVRPFSPDLVASRADVAAEDLVQAARIYASAGRGYAACGVGPGFSASSTLVEYLILDLESLCGHWLRAGEAVTRTTTLMPVPTFRAQAKPPRLAYGFGERLRVRDLTETVAGMPTGALSDEILLEGEGQVRALISVGGNPVTAWPDQLRTIDAIRSLGLLVQIDPWMSATARLADYVIAPKLAYETPGMTLMTDFIIAMPTYYGPAESYAHYTEKVVDPPPNSDVMAEWEFFYRLAQEMGLPLAIRRPALTDAGAPTRIPVPMDNPPTAEELLAKLAENGRVPLDRVKGHVHGASFPDPALVVEEKDPGWDGRLDLANPDMMGDLVALVADCKTSSEPPFRLICERLQHVMNSSLNFSVTNRGRGYNPARMHPSDLEALGLASGDAVQISSQRAAIIGIVHPDPGLRRGLIAMAHGFGDGPEWDDHFREIGSPTGRLLDNSDIADRYVGMPRISNIPVSVRPLAGSKAVVARTPSPPR